MEVATVGTPLNQVFYTGVVSLAVGVLATPNTLQTVWDCGTAYNYASMTTIVSGAPASTNIVLEGSLDGVNWTVLATSTSTTGDTQFATGAIPFSNLRARCTAVSGGTSPTVTIAAVAYQQAPSQITGGSSPGGSPVSGTVTANQGTAGASPWLVTDGQTAAVTHLNAATTGTGTVNDNGAAAQSYSFQIAVTGTVTAGAIQFMGSLDNVTFFNLGTAQLASSGVTAANPYTLVTGTSPMFNYAGLSVRYFRCDVSTTITGGATVTVKGLGY